MSRAEAQATLFDPALLAPRSRGEDAAEGAAKGASGASDEPAASGAKGREGAVREGVHQNAGDMLLDCDRVVVVQNRRRERHHNLG